jgi:hypothetical protein
VNLLASLDIRGSDDGLVESLEHNKQVLELVIRIKHDLAALPKDASDADAAKVLSNLVKPLFTLSKCPDYIVNRGHYFGTDRFTEEPGLSDEDKRALIEFLKTF